MTRNEIKNWLSDWLADAIGISADEIDEERTLGSYRLSSSQVATLADDIEEFFEEALETGIVIKRAKVERIIRELCILMDTDEETFDEEEPLRDPELLQDIGLRNVA